MEKIKLTKREYLGEGYVHEFLNVLTGRKEHDPITKEAYEALGKKDGWMLNPISTEERQYLCSFGGQPKLDTDDTLGGLNDCYQKDGKWYVYELKEIIPNKIDVVISEYSDEEFNNKFEIN